jgi:endonuclease/exonuclease/phosphatase family metal-dependent hydrolase
MDGEFCTGKTFSCDRNMVSTQGLHTLTWQSPDNIIGNQIDHILVDRRHYTNICDVRSMRGAEIESGHFLVRTKMIWKIKRREKTKRSELKKWDIG